MVAQLGALLQQHHSAAHHVHCSAGRSSRHATGALSHSAADCFRGQRLLSAAYSAARPSGRLSPSAVTTVQAAQPTEAAETSEPEDKSVARALAAFSLPCQSSASALLQGVRQECMSSLRTLRMPTTRNEDYRFTDVSALLNSQLRAPGQITTEEVASAVANHPLDEASSTRVVIVNGVMEPSLSNLDGLSEGIYVGGLAGAPAAAVQSSLGQQSRSRGGPFSVLNGATATEVTCIVVPAGAALASPLHVLYLTAGGAEGAVVAVAPRLLLVAEPGSAVELMEEFAPLDDNTAYFTNSVAEIQVGEGASVRHGYVQAEGGAAYHIKASLVSQAARSRYTLLQATTGARLSRHDLGIFQEGEETETVMRHFMLCGEGQVQDLHSKLRLQHPRGTASQLHKCIVSASTGRGVFDGNVKVERQAQQTDAGQLSRNLLLARRATVNVKPNLQIVADDVKCSHGCTVSDLEEDQLFYFRSRGVDQETARSMLVYSFGAEVTQGLKYPQLQQRIQVSTNAQLATSAAANALVAQTTADSDLTS